MIAVQPNGKGSLTNSLLWTLGEAKPKTSAPSSQLAHS
jgi:hypothetical protein